MKKLIPLLVLSVFIVSLGASYASAGSYAIHFSTRNLADDTDTITDVYPDSDVDKLLVINHSTKLPEAWGTDTSLVFENGIIKINPAYNFSQDQVDLLVPRFEAIETSLSGLGAPLNISAFMSNNASTSPYVATASLNGFMSTTDRIKVDGLSIPIEGTTTRSLTTSTGASGFRVSPSRPSNNCYSVTVVSGSALLAPVYGYIALEVSPTNSATSSDWVEKGRTGGGDTVGLLHTGTNSGQLCAFVPAGYYAKIRSVNVSGTATFSYNSGQEVIW